MDLTEEMSRRRDDLIAEKEGIDKELKGVEAYLKAVGVIKGRNEERKKA